MWSKQAEYAGRTCFELHVAQFGKPNDNQKSPPRFSYPHIPPIPCYLATNFVAHTLFCLSSSVYQDAPLLCPTLRGCRESCGCLLYSRPFGLVFFYPLYNQHSKILPKVREQNTMAQFCKPITKNVDKLPVRLVLCIDGTGDTATGSFNATTG